MPGAWELEDEGAGEGEDLKQSWRGSLDLITMTDTEDHYSESPLFSNYDSNTGKMFLSVELSYRVYIFSYDSVFFFSVELGYGLWNTDIVVFTALRGNEISF